MATGGRRLFVVGLVLVVGVGPFPARASEEAKSAEEVSLPPTLITEGATPATELEATFTVSKSAAERGYGFGFSSIQYAPIPSFGLKLIVPFAVRDPPPTHPPPPPPRPQSECSRAGPRPPGPAAPGGGGGGGGGGGKKPPLFSPPGGLGCPG